MGILIGILCLILSSLFLDGGDYSFRLAIILAVIGFLSGGVEVLRLYRRR